MQYTSLGNTGLKVSVAGIGCGGHSRIGLSSGKSAVESAAIIRQAVDLGVNFIDTAAAYGTEAIVGRAISEVKREEVVISSKARVCDLDGALHPVEEVVASLDQSLANLGIDCIDVFHLHGVPPRHYDYATEMVVPALLRERDKGKFSYLGITEIPPHDPDHDMLLQMQSGDGDLFGVIMVAYHMLNQSAKDLVFPHALDQGIGVLIMFGVRILFSEPGRLAREVNRLVDAGQLPATLRGEDPLGFLIHDGGAHSVIDAAYRYCRHTAGADVILFGTGSADHLRANVNSILGPPLPAKDVEQLETLFAGLSGIGLDFADGHKK